MRDHRPLFEQKLHESCQELFESIGVPAWPIEGDVPIPSSSRQIAAVLAFGGWQVRGSLTLRSQVDFFRETHPTVRRGRSCTQEQIADWSGELVNQLLGRFKNKLLPYGLDFGVNVPTTLSGENMAEANLDRENAICLDFRTPRVVSVALSGRVSAGVHLRDPREGRAPLPPGKPFDL